MRSSAADGHGRFESVSEAGRIEVEFCGEGFKLGIGSLTVVAGFDGGVGFDAYPSDGLADLSIEVGLDIAGVFAGDESPVCGFVEDVVGGSKVFADFIGLANDVGEEGKILVLIGDEVKDGDIAGLPVSIDSAVSLFDAGGGSRGNRSEADSGRFAAG